MAGNGKSRLASRSQRLLIAIALLAGLWALAIVVLGGFVLELGPLHVSSRTLHNPLLIVVVSLTAAWALMPARAGPARRTPDGRALPATASGQALLIPPIVTRHAPALAFAAILVLAAGVAWLGVARGAHVAGGADSYGYVSQAHLWAAGRLTVPQPLLDDPPGGIRQEALAPLGYRLSPERNALVPFYAPGFPMTMALFELAAGPDAVFAAMPLLAAVAVWATFALGVRVAGRGVGLAAALLLATSPAFVFQLTHAPMSDIPAAAWWTVALVLAARQARSSALLSGLAVSAAILTRPNLVPLAIVPAAALIWPREMRRAGRRPDWRRGVLFALGTVPGAAAVAILNSYWYGSPVESGYGQLAGTFYRWEYFAANAVRYPVWLGESQGILVFAAVAAPLLWRHRLRPLDHPAVMLLACTAFVVLTYACYAFYLPFDAWWVLRFLLPAFPPLFVLTGAALAGLASRLTARAASVAIPLLISMMVLHAIDFSREQSAYDSTAERRYETAGRHIAAHFPARAVFLSALHSGSIRHYSGRLTIRYDLIEPERLQPAIADLRRLGYTPYVAVDDAEREAFVERFGGTPAGRLDAPPVARVDGVAIYAATP